MPNGLSDTRNDRRSDRPVTGGAARKLRLTVMAPPLLVLALLCGLGVGSLQMMGAVRAYVTGESLWSKARSAAVMALEDHVQSGDARDLARFESALRVNDGDRRAREALLKDPVDVAAARQGFVDGGNRMADIDGMIGLFRLFGTTWIFHDALQAWMAGDILLAELRTVAVQRAAAGAAGSPSHRQFDIAQAKARVRDINQRLLVQERRFIDSLNQAALVTERILQGCLLAAALLLSALYVLVAQRTLRRRERDAQAVQLARERWDLAVLAAGLGRYDLDVDRGLFTLDAHAAALHGLPPAATTLGRASLALCLHPDDQDAVRQQLDGAIAKGQVSSLRYRVALPDGRIRHIESTGRIERSGGTTRHRSPHLMGILRDVTDEVAQAQAAIQRDAAERVAASQRAFLSRLSHELRTPLNAILGFAQLLDLDRQSAMSAAQRQQVHWILRAGRQLLALVEDVLDLSKVEAGEVTMRPQALTLQQLVRDCLPLVDAVRQQHQVQLIDALPEAPLPVWADRQRLQQVFINLLNNGCKYNREGGELRIHAREDGNAIVVEVSDSGIGMSEAEQAELFQPFKRPAKGSAHIEGTGLGLYIVRQLLERMQGSVSVRSQVGVGTCFTVRLPRSELGADVGVRASEALV